MSRRKVRVPPPREEKNPISIIVGESKQRSLVKAVSWRVFALLLTILIIFIFTGNLVVTLEISGVWALVATIGFYIHERLWLKVKWGYE